MLRLPKIIFATLIIFISHLPQSVADEPEVIVVTGSAWAPNPLIVTCYGSACRGAAVSLKAELEKLLKPAKELDDDEEGESSKSKFCNMLKGAVPSGCNERYGVGTIPGFQWNSLLGASNWLMPPLTNGCGSSSPGFAEELGTTLGKRLFNWTGDQDEPVTGYSFLNACNNHDQCFADRGGFESCNRNFWNELENQCNGNEVCNTAAHAYRAVVGSTVGETAYSEAAIYTQCANYQDDFKENCVSGGSSGGT